MFNSPGIIKVKLKANDRGGLEEIIEFNVTDKKTIIDTSFNPMGELLDDEVPVVISMTNYPEDAFTNLTFQIIDRLIDSVNISIDKNNLICKVAGVVKVRAFEQYTNTEYIITVIGFEKGKLIEFTVKTYNL